MLLRTSDDIWKVVASLSENQGREFAIWCAQHAMRYMDNPDKRVVKAVQAITPDTTPKKAKALVDRLDRHADKTKGLKRLGYLAALRGVTMLYDYNPYDVMVTAGYAAQVCFAHYNPIDHLVYGKLVLEHEWFEITEKLREIIDA